ncbi:MAG: DNA methyltransferase [Candidatus Diapherotrites archaeon]
MQSFLFVLGRNPELSVLEILRYFEVRHIGFELKNANQHAAEFEILPEINVEQVVNELGGTVKICRELGSLDEKGSLHLSQWDLAKSKKFYYSVNDVSTLPSPHIEQLREYLKERFKEEKVKAMYKPPRLKGPDSAKALNPSQLKKRKQVEEGLDLNVFESKIFQTLAVSNVQEMKARDIDRPHTKAPVGTSIRMAKILNNLAGARKGVTVLDPFCGMGTVAQESMLLGANAIGVEKNADHYNLCQKNLGWAKKKYALKTEFKLYQKDAKELARFLKKGDFQAVASEPEQGPYWKTIPRKNVAFHTMHELNELYEKVFEQLSALMDKGQKIAIILPEISADTGSVSASEVSFIEHGFGIVTPPRQIPKANPYFYRDSKNKIARRIYLLEKR